MSSLLAVSSQQQTLQTSFQHMSMVRRSMSQSEDQEQPSRSCEESHSQSTRKHASANMSSHISLHLSPQRKLQPEVPAMMETQKCMLKFRTPDQEKTTTRFPPRTHPTRPVLHKSTRTQQTLGPLSEMKRCPSHDLALDPLSMYLRHSHHIDILKSKDR
ncbi:hypothetical protein BLNAU_19545 [Blattamonas nauphoetae]|uniref:Uncharacterized protein n=1 Tax=Blattamonas nauphoetae TaxID=2049346 RepID=A0ABQ9X4E3_9EUKA|nr:hypothetical protein BLNAU_19545 [Blattamonas nauphoetae]